MAGVYPDAPSRRMAWDLDGCAVFGIKGKIGYPGSNLPPVGQMTAYSLSDKQKMNGEDNSSVGFSGNQATIAIYVYIFFPELRDLDGYFVARIGDHTGHFLSHSDDSTNAHDGTFTSWGTETQSTATVNDAYRTAVVSDVENGKVATGHAIKATAGAIADNVNFRAIHIYGTIAAGETPDRILFLDTENSDAEFTKILDFGDIPRGQTTTRTFKLKNNSASKSINSVSISAEDLVLEAGDWYEFGSDGINYQASHAVGNMSNGAEETVYLKQIVPDGATLGPQTGRIKAEHTSVT